MDLFENIKLIVGISALGTFILFISAIFCGILLPVQALAFIFGFGLVVCTAAAIHITWQMKRERERGY